MLREQLERGEFVPYKLRTHFPYPVFVAAVLTQRVSMRGLEAALCESGLFLWI